jgi:hypothetical protein
MISDRDPVEALLHKQKIAMLEELKQFLGTPSTMTVFRKLKSLGYQTSYSHRGQYYTLVKIPEFDRQGLWSYRDVWFSRDGNLLHTAQRFVEQAVAGVTASELQALLSVEVKDPLLQLYRRKRVAREEIDGAYVYLSRQPSTRRQQRLQRQSSPVPLDVSDSSVQVGLGPELKAAIILFYSLLDEQQRRLYAGLEAHKLGHGGDRKIAEFLGLDPHTVARGRQELFSRQIQQGGIRKKGAGRTSTEKKRQR